MTCFETRDGGGKYTPCPDEMADMIAEDAWEIWMQRRYAEGCPEIGSNVLVDGEEYRVFSVSSSRWSSEYGRMMENHLVNVCVRRGDESRHVLWPTAFDSGHAQAVVA
jgi:hypothetical protein